MRHALLSALFLVPTLLGVLPAQCLDTTGGTSAGLVAIGTDPVNDEGRSAPTAIGFAFPLGGSTYSHVVVDSNGVLYLTNGGAAVGAVTFGAANTTHLRGNPGDSPRVFPLWTDLEGAGGWAVTIDQSVPGRCKVVWFHVREFFSVGQGSFSFSASLFGNGAIEFAYSTLPALPNWTTYAAVGVSAGNAVGTGFEVSQDLTAGGSSGALPLLFETFDGFVPNVSLAAIQLQPNGLGGYQTAVTCQGGAHTRRGAGCYGDSVYQFYRDAAAAAAGLQGNRLSLAPTAAGYVATWVPGGAAAFVPPPVGANLVPRTDDGEFALDLAAAGLASLPFPGGSASVLYVHSNGFVSLATGNDGGAWNNPFHTDWQPSPSFRNAPATAFWAWHDWEPADLGGGAIVWHHVVGTNTLHVTWDGVENASSPVVANPGTFQFQFHLATGAVDYVWVAVDGNTSSPAGSAHLVGYSPGGVSADPGELPFAIAGGTTTIQTLSALSLSASPAPQILVTGTSNAIDYTLANLPDYAAPAGVRLGILVFSVAAAPGIDLGFVGAPGCQIYLGSLDVQLPVVAVGGATQALSITFPAPLAAGLTFQSQAFALVPPNSLPGGLNDFGLLSSNGLATRF